MNAIRKKIVTDEDARPVAVQIDYEDWLEIERLTEKTSRGRTEGVGRPLVEHTPDLSSRGCYLVFRGRTSRSIRSPDSILASSRS